MLCVDVEGFDLVAIESMTGGDFALTWRPLRISNSIYVTQVRDSPIHRFLDSVDYHLRAHWVLASLHSLH